MDQNTPWGKVTDFSWYVEARLRSLTSDNPMQRDGQDLATIYMQGRDKDYTLEALEVMNLPEFWETFFKESIDPKKYAKYNPNTPVNLIALALSEKYYLYDGYILEQKATRDSLKISGRVVRSSPWYTGYLSEVPGQIAQEKLGSKELLRSALSPFGLDFMFGHTSEKMIRVALEERTVQVMGSVTPDELEQCFRSAIEVFWDPALDVQMYHDRNDGMPRTLSEMREEMSNQGVKSVALDSLTLKDGRVIPLGKLQFSPRGGGVYQPHVNGDSAIMLFASIFGQKVK